MAEIKPPDYLLPLLSAGVRDDLQTFADLLRQWQKTHNLVSPSTIDDLWQRHMFDSLQILLRGDKAQSWLDLGSGAGFPGLVIALAAPKPVHVDLVESNGKKAAFLRAVIRRTGAPADVHQVRIEELSPDFHSSDQRAPDVITARALAPLPRLFDLAAPLCGHATRLIFPKGKEFDKEVAMASQCWTFDLLDYPSITDPGGRVLLFQHLKRKPGS